MYIQSNVDPNEGNMVLNHSADRDHPPPRFEEGCTLTCNVVQEVHPHGARCTVGRDGESRDLWLPREVTQRLIYFTGGLVLHLHFFALFSAEHRRRVPHILPPVHRGCINVGPRRGQQPTLCHIHDRSAAFTRGYIVFT